jgi:hypothetical protein
MSAPIVLFSSASLNLDSPLFQINNQKTIIAVGMDPGDYITFEIVQLSPGVPSSVCGCYISAMRPGSVIGIEQMQCPACESATLRPVRLTSRNPVVILDLPQETFVRAMYNGTGVNNRSVYVYAYETATPNLTDAMRGCPPVCCEDEEQIWIDTGARRCTASAYERLEISNCGNHRWVDHGPLVWQPTTEVRCDHEANMFFTQEVNNCGETRWVSPPGQIIPWTETGNERCNGANVEREERTPCGDLRWVVNRPIEWVATGERRCTSTTVEEQERDNCGNLRWVARSAANWVPTCCETCDDTNVYRQERNACGDLRMVLDRLVSWQYTGATRCTSLTFEQQQVNDCGRIRWEAQPISWTPTGATECREDSLFRQEANNCGTLRWVDTGQACIGSTHEILSIVGADITEGQVAQWTVTLDAPVSGAPLTINFTLSGSEQAINSYPAPSLIIPIGQTVGVLAVQTTDDTTIEVTQELCAQAQISPRVTAVPGAPGCLDVLDNDTPTGDSTHIVVCITQPANITEGQTVSWTVQLDSVVAGSDLVVTSTLSGSEQAIHGYPAPSVVIPIGASSGVLSVTTTDDTTVESSQQLCLTVNTSARITAVNNIPCP